MTPEQAEALNGQVKDLPVIIELQNADQEIIKDLEGLKQGQDQLSEKVETGFEKGRKRMDGIEGELKAVKEMIAESDKARDIQHGELKSEIRNREISELRDELRGRKETTSKITVGLVLLAASAFIGYVGWSVGQIIGK